jgi:hypothetical protein
MKISDLEDSEKVMTKEYLDIGIGKLKNDIDARFNALEGRLNGFDTKFNTQKTLLIVAIIGIAAQIINAWFLHVK